jgi:fucose permease
MSAVSLLVGRAFPERCASILTFLNFSWSIGALAAPLLAAQVLHHHSYRTAYLLLSLAAVLAALVCALTLDENRQPVRSHTEAGTRTTLRLILIFAVAAFLEVGIENTVTAWLPTYTLRMAQSGIAIAAASSSFYWVGYLFSRGLSSLLLLRVQPVRVFRFAVLIALVAAMGLAFLPSIPGRNAAMFFLGVALAPIFPLVIAGSLARMNRTSDSRWVLATAGFGGSVLPWLAGWISAHTGSLRMGMLTIPSALALMLLILPAFRATRAVSAEPQEASFR